MPERIQLSRRKGWRMPENTVSVARPTAYGNRFHIGLPANPTAADCVRRFREEQVDEYRGFMLERLRGKNLACWCPLDQACHADVLLEIANSTSDLAMTRRATIRRAVLGRISRCGDMHIRIRDTTFESLLRTLGFNWETNMGGADGFREIDAVALEALAALADKAERKAV